MRVCHVSPTYFAPESVLGGGERYAEELARAQARQTEVKLVSFGRSPRRERLGPSFERVILRSWTRRQLTPFSPRLALELRGADVVHCHQYFVLPTFLACLFGHLQGSRVFVTDLGGGDWTPAYQLDQSRWITAHLPLSDYAARALPGRNKRFRVVYGGVDTARFRMRPHLEHDGSVVFLGRLLPHKGVHYLIEGLPGGMPLHVLGNAPDPAYLERLRRLAAGKPVQFHLGLPDESLIPYLQRAMALVHPTPVDAAGLAGVNELFGLAVVEAMACGCPVVASDVASLPEIALHGETGLLVRPNDPAAIREALTALARDAEEWRKMACAARARVEAQFTWDAVAQRCLQAYHEIGGGHMTGFPPAPATDSQASRFAPRRRTAWLSSETADPRLLADLDLALRSYYTDTRKRAEYQVVLDGDEEPAETSVRKRLPAFLCELNPGRLLEIGCGSGRVAAQLRERGFRGRYIGVDLPAEVLGAARFRLPAESWARASAYALPFRDAAFDAVFSLYVLEHVVYPRRGLEEMLRVVRPGGELVLVFPDFTHGGILASQQVGLSPGGTARDKLRAGRILDAFVSLYDSRIRLPRLLRSARRRLGAFPINTRPLCLGTGRSGPDLDAVYIASRAEIHEWAQARGCSVAYPEGWEGEFAFQVFMSIRQADSVRGEAPHR